MPDPRGTLVAEATPPGRGSLRVVRLSGEGALALLRALFEPEGFAPWDHPRRLCLGTIQDQAGTAMDEGLAVYFAAPASFTGEEMAEFQCHGSPGVVEALKAACVALGARPALPGEFSFRAFLNGKLSLPDAEAVQALTACETALQARACGPEAARGLSRRAAGWRDRLLDVMASWEARLDFPEDAPALAGAERAGALAELSAELGELLEAAGRARPLRRGWRVALCGPPNSGKSSLFNALLQRERALVTPHPGTTRDVIEEAVDLEGLPVVLLDTAGVRAPGDPVEALGIERGLAAAREADGVLLLWDGSRGWDEETQRLLETLSEKLVAAVETRADLGPSAGDAPAGVPGFRVSNTTGEGLAALAAHLAAWARRTLPAGGLLLLNDRQLSALAEARRACDGAEALLAAGESEEVALQELRAARRALDDLLGGSDPEALYDRVFRAFCIGK